MRFVGFTRFATDKMIQSRISCVVKKPVCTPVPPAGYGNAAGYVGYAPPAITWSEMAKCRLAASGTISFSNLIKPECRAAIAAGIQGSSRIKKRQIISIFWGTIPSQPPPRGERSWFPCASALPWVRLPSHPMFSSCADARTAGSIDCLASGVGENSHSPTRVIILLRA